MPAPVYQELLDELTTEKNRGGTPRVLELMKSKVEPQIARMPRRQLEVAFTEAIYAMYHMVAELHANEDCMEIAHQDRLMWKYTAGHLTEELKTAPSKMGKRAVEVKLARDPKQQEKFFVNECWKRWQEKPDSYKSKAAFARDMLEKCEHLTSQKKIEDWCRKWEKRIQLAG